MMMNTSGIKQEMSNASARTCGKQNDDDFDKSISIINHLNSSKPVIKIEDSDGMSSSDEVSAKHITAFPNPLHSQADVKQESSTTQGVDTLIRTSLDNVLPADTSASLPCRVKAEPASDDEQDTGSTPRCLNVAIKQETIQVKTDEVKQMNSSNYKNDVVKSEEEYILPHNDPDTDMSEDSDSMDDNAEEHLGTGGSKTNISQKRVKKSSHENKSDHMCSVCGKVFFKKRVCLQHMLTMHTEERPFECEFCGKTFRRMWDLKCHGTTHSDERPHPCDLCDKTFKQKFNLIRHKTIYHSSERPYSCDMCEKAFKEKAHLLRHKATSHSNERPYSCDLCNKTFKDKSIVVKHKAIFHSSEKPYSCDMCEKTFKQKGSLRQHKEACHSDERPYCCNVCNKTYKRKDTLQIHVAACHSDERPFSCDLCEKTFKQKTSLLKHKSVFHSDERPFACNLCEKTFKRKANLKQHEEASHSNERRYCCDLCEKRFKQKSTLQTHKAACHSDEKTYSCDMCEKTFKFKEHVYKHKIVCHSNERSLVISVQRLNGDEKADLHVNQ